MTAHGKYQIFANTGHFKVKSHLLVLVPDHFIVSHPHLQPLPLNLCPSQPLFSVWPSSWGLSSLQHLS